MRALHQEMLGLAHLEAVRRQVGLRVTEVGPGDIDIYLDPAVPCHDIHYVRDWAGRLDHHLPFPVAQEQEASPPSAGRRPPRRRSWRLAPVRTATVTIRLPSGFVPA